MKQSACLGWLACIGLLFSATSARPEQIIYQPCFERPVFDKTVMEAPQRERVVREHPKLAQPQFEKPQTVARMVELPAIEKPDVEQVIVRPCERQRHIKPTYVTPRTPAIIVDKWGNVSSNTLQPVKRAPIRTHPMPWMPHW